MKLLNYILFNLFLIVINKKFVISDQCLTPLQDLQIKDSCNLESSKLIIKQEDYLTLDSIKLTSLPPSNSIIISTYNIKDKTYEWNLIDSVDYSLEYIYKGCSSSNTNIQKIKSNGMYYKLKTQPLCLYTQFNYTVYNYNSNGDSKDFQAIPSTIEISNQDNSCTMKIFITPLLSKGALENNAITYKHPTCGFSNGTISIDSSVEIYSNYHLFLKNDTNFQNEIQPTSSLLGSYINLEANEYYLFIESNECGRERIEIILENIYPKLNLEFKNISNMFYNDSILSFSFDDKSIIRLNNNNKSNVVIWYSSEDLTYITKISQWEDYKDIFYKNFIYGYYYEKDFSISPSYQSPSICKFQQYISNTRSLSQINYTIIEYNNNNNYNNSNNNSNISCLNNVIVEIFSPFKNDEIILTSINDNLIYNINKNNNQSSIPYNNQYKISSKVGGGGGDIYFSTIYKKLDYRIIETSSNEGCWKTFNITIGNYEKYKNLILTGYEDLKVYPINGVFINVPSNQFIISYIVDDCKTESIIKINEYYSNYTPLDKVLIDYAIIKNATCFTSTLIRYLVKSPIGNFSGTFEINDNNNDYQGFAKAPNSLCFIPLSYSSKLLPPIIDNNIDFNYTIVKTPSCSIQTGLISVLLNDSNYLNILNNIESNGESLIQDPSNVNNYFIKSGENNIKLTFNDGSKTCYRTKLLNIQKINSINPQFILLPVTDCKNPNGAIIVLNYQEFTTIELYSSNNQLLNKITNSSSFDNLESGDYILYFQSTLCSGSKIIRISSSEDNVEITLNPIRNPTCDNNNNNNNNYNTYADGRVGITLKKDGLIIKNFTVTDFNYNNYFFNGVFEIAASGLNQINIIYGSCIWSKSITLQLDDPKFLIINIFNQTTCHGLNSPIYKLISNNSNVVIDTITYITANSYSNYQNQHFISNPYRYPLTYTVNWNNICKNTFTTYYDYDDDNYQLKLDYEIIYPNGCNSFKFDIIIKNMNSFKSVLLSGNTSPISINSTHSIFKNVVPSETYEFTFTSSSSGCDGVYNIYRNDLPITNVNETLDIKLTNDICSSGNGLIQLLNIDTDYYYYYLRSPNFNDDSDDNSFSLPIYNNSNNTFLKNVKDGSYSIYRGCKSMINCIIDTKITIGNDNPSIKSFKIINSWNNTLNNGSVEIELNYNSSYPTNFEIIGTDLSNINGKFKNLSAKSYQLKITITDRMCPTILTKNFTIRNLEEQPSTSTILQTNHLLSIVLLLIIIII
ncbi:hypothetical protein RB653_009831 [Dictyostelium firmibasis]|uniref:Uncharacterized protein n=1 Tax=Dictyostelium firmibasis TaxID=79012 RepID=A0AAN7TZZ8_9MYCE